MIRFTVWKSKQNQYDGFEVTGHADYADAGEDIVCAAVSVLAINTVNSIEELTDDDFVMEQAEDGGYLKLQFNGKPGAKSSLLMDSLVLGIRSIEADYGNEYITLKSEEV